MCGRAGGATVTAPTGVALAVTAAAGAYSGTFAGGNGLSVDRLSVTAGASVAAASGVALSVSGPTGAYSAVFSGGNGVAIDTLTVQGALTASNGLTVSSGFVRLSSSGIQFSDSSVLTSANPKQNRVTGTCAAGPVIFCGHPPGPPPLHPPRLFSGGAPGDQLERPARDQRSGES
eukprot:TRINITY_DN2978_c0_g1_i1.p2 TRINITY_DN2978_c0_g1~~TRINITY_DN2978_c0_g1_i1.p2  ORF type:complete len:175 (+),score=37.86 TRINITY_DN2978_c0_g1_i1:116-640(+)